MAVVAGFDFGAVNIKVSTANGNQTFENKIKSNELVKAKRSITIDGKQWIYGDQGEYDFGHDVKFQQARFIPLMFAALCEIEPHENNFKVVTGLPIMHFKKYKDEMAELIKGNSEKLVEFNGMTRLIKVEDVQVFVEGWSSLYSLTASELEQFNGREILCVDIGGSTVDITLFDVNSDPRKGNDRGVIQYSSLPLGMYNVYNDIKNYIKTNIGDEYIDIEKCKKILEGTLIHSYNGKDTDLKFIEDILFDNTLKMLKGMKLDYAQSLKSATLYLCGGGSKFFYKYFKAIQQNTVCNQNIFSNSIGYKTVGESIWK